MKQAVIIGILALAALITIGSYRLSAQSPQSQPMTTTTKAPAQPTKPVKLTDDEWKKKLTPEQYRILRQAGTERAHGDVYKQFKKQGSGTYYCAGCDAELFHSETKFDSECGWPSFFDPSKAKNIKTDTDYHLGYPRTEVRCAVCDGHLGHVFKGESFRTLGNQPTPTGQRYCINGTVLKFVPDNTPTKKAENPKGKEDSPSKKIQPEK